MHLGEAALELVQRQPAAVVVLAQLRGRRLTVGVRNQRVEVLGHPSKRRTRKGSPPWWKRPKLRATVCPAESPLRCGRGAAPRMKSHAVVTNVVKPLRGRGASARPGR